MKQSIMPSHANKDKIPMSPTLQTTFDTALITTDSIDSLFSKFDLVDAKNQEVFMGIIKQKVLLLVAQNPENKQQIFEYLVRVRDKNNSILSLRTQKIRHEIF